MSTNAAPAKATPRRITVGFASSARATTETGRRSVLSFPAVSAGGPAGSVADRSGAKFGGGSISLEVRAGVFGLGALLRVAQTEEHHDPEHDAGDAEHVKRVAPAV